VAASTSPTSPPPTLVSPLTLSDEVTVEDVVPDVRSPHLPKWVKAVDETYDTEYYFNTVTGESKWNVPDGYVEPEEGSECAKAVAAYVAARVQMDHAEKSKRLTAINSGEELESPREQNSQEKRKESLTVAQLAEQFVTGAQKPADGRKRGSSTAGDFKKEIESSGNTVKDRIRKLSAASATGASNSARDLLQKKKEEEMDTITRSRGSSNAFASHYEALQEIERDVVNRKDF